MSSTTIRYNFSILPQVITTINKVLPLDIARVCAEYSFTGIGRYIPWLKAWITKNINAIYDVRDNKWNIEMSAGLCTVMGYESALRKNHGVYKVDNFVKHRQSILRGLPLTSFGPYLSHKIFMGQVADENCQFVLFDLISTRILIFAHQIVFAW